MTNQPTDAQVREWAAGAALATTGPWELAPQEGRVKGEYFVAASECPIDGGNIICTAPPMPVSRKHWKNGNATFIAASRTSVPILCATVLAQRAEIAGLRAELETARAGALEEAAKAADVWANTKPDLEKSDNPTTARTLAWIISDTGNKVATAIRALTQGASS